MVVSYINSKLLQHYKTYSRAIVYNEPCALKNRLIRILTTKSLSIRNQVNHIVPTSSTMVVTPTSTTESSTTLDIWPRHTLLAALPLVVIMYKFRKISCVASVAMLAMCCMFHRIERAPFSGRRHLVFREPEQSSNSIPGVWVDDYVKDVRKDRNLLPPMHQKTLRVASIAHKLGQGMHEVLGLQSGSKIVAYEPGNNSCPVWSVGERTRKNSLIELKDTLNHIVGRGSSSYIGLTSEVFDQAKMDFRAHKDLEGLEWKVIVVNSNCFKASSGLYNTIFMHTDLIDRCSDEELAFVIGHEMGHAIARHLECEEVWNPLKFILEEVIMLLAFLFSSDPCPPEEEIKLEVVINNFQRRRNEYEADHITMMLMASAGYDPKGAPMWLSKYASSTHFGSHPTRAQRVGYLKNPKRIKEAMRLYRDVRSLKLIRNLIENSTSALMGVQHAQT